MQTKPQICWWILYQQLCKLSVQDICTFSTYGINLYQPLSLGVQITFHTTKCYDCILNFENIFSIHPIAKVLLSLGKRTMKSTDKKKHSLLTIEYNWIADCSYCNFFLIRNLTVWLFNDLLQFPEFAIIIGTIFAVYFFKNCAISLAGTVERKYIEWIYCSSALFFKHTTYLFKLSKTVFRSHNTFVKCLQQ